MKFENIPLNCTLAFTINFDNKFQHFGENGRMIKCTKRMIHIIKSCRWADICVVPEYSFNQTSSCMTVDGPRYHFHGTIVITDLDEFMELGYRELHNQGTFKIDTLTKDFKWDTYLSKSKERMKPLCAKRQIPYCLSNKIKLHKYPVLKRPYKDVHDYATRHQIDLDDLDEIIA